jgi:DNA-binding NtrC family response regulator
MNDILVLAEDQDISKKIRDSLQEDYGIESVHNLETALGVLKSRRCDIVFADISFLKVGGENHHYHEALKPFKDIYPTIEIIVMSSPEAIREAVMMVKAGASNYLTYPLNPDEVRYITEEIRTSVIIQSELDYLRDQFWRKESLEIIQTRSPRMKEVFNKIRSVAPTRSTVLLMGETGTGKGVMAGLIHQHSNRRDVQFISVHCGAIPDTLIESELFGHEKGAFTGAVRRKLGKFEIARGGTIFLDEIGTITPPAQIKLLQVLQDGTFQRVGGETTLEANARVIAATNVDLKELCEKGLFRRDLYYRLNVFPIELPALRERPEDIPHLIQGFLSKMNTYESKKINKVHPMVEEALYRYSWPGNIRELENLIERAFILERSDTLTPESFPGEILESSLTSTSRPVDINLALSEARNRVVEDFEQNYLKELLTVNNGRIQDTARSANITTRQLHKLMTKHGLRKEQFKG